ncbi:helix-turn-helix domain-containing protein [Alteromonas sp. a30]|uniref:helix-turn-helix domain-containing protein n=1 Tax=Alteromonas sp. a30 TaxID=2730917 RepID=UPI00227E27D6|nr:helix-turn-helix domain-containing protein [Alteromonas sp. a30]MCY7296681.1 hypothetical protein [Alteromonas sp. a30]
MTEFDVTAIFQRMHKACGVKNDYQLSKFLAVKASTVKGWKDAKHPPYKACYEIYERTGVSVEWLLSGKTVNEPMIASKSNGKNQGADALPDFEAFASKYLKSIEAGLISGFIRLESQTTQDEIIIMARQLYAELVQDELIPKGKSRKAS